MMLLPGWRCQKCSYCPGIACTLCAAGCFPEITMHSGVLHSGAAAAARRPSPSSLAAAVCISQVSAKQREEAASSSAVPRNASEQYCMAMQKRRTRQHSSVLLQFCMSRCLCIMMTGLQNSYFSWLAVALDPR